MQLCISDRWCQPTYAFSSRNDGHCMLLCRPKAAGPALIYHACSTIQEPSIATHHQQILHVLLFLLSFCFLSSLGALSDLSLSMSVSLCRHTHTSLLNFLLWPICLQSPQPVPIEAAPSLYTAWFIKIEQTTYIM